MILSMESPTVSTTENNDSICDLVRTDQRIKVREITAAGGFKIEKLNCFSSDLTWILIRVQLGVCDDAGARNLKSRNKLWD